MQSEANFLGMAQQQRQQGFVENAAILKAQDDLKTMRQMQAQLEQQERGNAAAEEARILAEAADYSAKQKQAAEAARVQPLQQQQQQEQMQQEQQR